MRVRCRVTEHTSLLFDDCSVQKRCELIETTKEYRADGHLHVDMHRHRHVVSTLVSLILLLFAFARILVSGLVSNCVVTNCGVIQKCRATNGVGVLPRHTGPANIPVHRPDK